MWKRISSALLFATSAALAERVELTRPVMGTLARITVETNDPPRAGLAIEQAFARLADLNAKLSDYDPLSELNRNPPRKSRDLQHVLHHAAELRRLTGGAFNHEAGTVIRLWRDARQRGVAPTPAQIEAARTAERKVDLGGIAKGYAAGEALALLRRHGFRRAMVAIAGDICVGDPPAGRPGWRIEVAPGSARRLLELHQSCVSTSGDAEQAFEANGRRYSHIIDPRTGHALTHPIGVTVVARQGIIADALATALSVTGLREDLLRRYHAAAIVWTPESTRESLFELFERARPIRAEQPR